MASDLRHKSVEELHWEVVLLKSKIATAEDEAKRIEAEQQLVLASSYLLTKNSCCIVR